MLDAINLVNNELIDIHTKTIKNQLQFTNNWIRISEGCKLPTESEYN
jgi:hypothetical protein